MKKLYNLMLLIMLFSQNIFSAEAGPAKVTDNEKVKNLVTGEMESLKSIRKRFSKNLIQFKENEALIKKAQERCQQTLSEQHTSISSIYQKLNDLNFKTILAKKEYKNLVKLCKFLLYSLQFSAESNNLQGIHDELKLSQDVNSLLSFAFKPTYQNISPENYFLVLSVKDALEKQINESAQNSMYNKTDKCFYSDFIEKSRTVDPETVESSIFKNVTNLIIKNQMCKYTNESQRLLTNIDQKLQIHLQVLAEKHLDLSIKIDEFLRNGSLYYSDQKNLKNAPALVAFYNELESIDIPECFNIFEDNNGKKWKLPLNLLEQATPVEEVSKKDGKKPLVTDERPLEELLAGLGIQEELPKKTITSHAKKQSKTTKKNKKKPTASSCAQALSACELSESSEDEFAITEEPFSKASEKEPALSGPLALKTRIVDWFINPDRALLKQGYIEGAPQAELFKYQLLKRYGKDAIIQNHRFPRALDTLILHDAAYCNITQHPTKKNCYTLVSPGYIKQGHGIIQFGQYEYSFEKKSEGRRVIFHRFFRPMQQHEVLQRFTSKEGWKDIEKIGIKVDLPNDVYLSDEDKALFTNGKWQSEYEQEGWTITHKKCCSLLNKEGSLVEYGIHTKQ